MHLATAGHSCKIFPNQVACSRSRKSELLCFPAWNFAMAFPRAPCVCRGSRGRGKVRRLRPAARIWEQVSMGVATQAAAGSFRLVELDVVLAAFEATAESLLLVEDDHILLAN